MYSQQELKDKLAAIGYDGRSKRDAKVVEALLSVAVTLNEYDLAEMDENVVLELLSSDGRERLKNLPDKVIKQEWRDFDYGNVKLGDYVRVKKDAYDSESGSVHNGLVGILSFMSGHRCSVNYIGLGAGRTMKHAMEKLESLKRV